MAKILVGVTGGIAAYKSASVVSGLVSMGHDVRVIMTEKSKLFVGPLTFSALSHNFVYGDDLEFASDGHIWHIELAQWAELFVIVPATYNTIMKIKNGVSDNLLSSTVVPYIWEGKKLIIFPSMNTNMYQGLDKTWFKHWPNIVLTETANGKMACGSIGMGKLLSTKDIFSIIKDNLKGSQNE